MEKVVILKALVGSRGYGVFGEKSDYDYRGVYVIPTTKILSLGYKYKGTHWVEDKEGGIDDTMYEIGHFLQLATQCNPTILNTLKAPIVEANVWGRSLIDKFCYFMDAKRCYDAFTGYGLNQRKKMLDNKDNRWNQYGAAYVRQLVYLRDLFRDEDYSFVIIDPEFKKVVRDVKDKKWSPGKIIDYCSKLRQEIDDIVETQGWPEFGNDIEKVNEFLINVRRAHWTL